MAFYKQDEEEDLLNPEQGPVQSGPQTAALDAGASAPSSQSSSNSPTPDKGSNFVGIKQYLDANKSQASKLGDQTANVVANSANEARQGVNQLQDTFNQKAVAPVQMNQGVLDKVSQGAETLNDDEKNLVKNKFNAAYSGPNDLFDNSLSEQFQTANKKLNTANQNIANVGTEEGRKQLITQVNAKPRTSGALNFDNALLQAGGGRDKLASVAQANQDVKDDSLLKNSNLAAQQKAADLKSQTENIRNTTRNTVNTAMGNLTKQFDANDPNSKLSQAIARALKADKVVADLQDNPFALDADSLAELGLREGQSTFGVDPSKYYQQGDPTTYNAQNVASQEDFARYAALAELAGVDPSLLKPEDAAKAGTLKSSTVNKDKLMADIAARGKNYQEFDKPATQVTNNKFNSVVDQLVDGAQSSWEPGFKDMYKVDFWKNQIRDKSPKQLEAMLPSLDAQAKDGVWRGRKAQFRTPEILAKNIRSYLDTLKKSLDSKYTVSKNK